MALKHADARAAVSKAQGGGQTTDARADDGDMRVRCCHKFWTVRGFICLV